MEAVTLFGFVLPLRGFQRRTDWTTDLFLLPLFP